MVNLNYLGNGLQLDMLKEFSIYCLGINKKYILLKYIVIINIP